MNKMEEALRRKPTTATPTTTIHGDPEATPTQNIPMHHTAPQQDHVSPLLEDSNKNEPEDTHTDKETSFLYNVTVAQITD